MTVGVATTTGCGGGWRRRDDVRDGTHDSGYQPESTRVVRPVMGTRRRWRRRRWTVVAAMMAMGHVMDGRGAVPAVMMSAGTRTGVGCCRDCESAYEGDEKFLVVHITPDFLFLRFCRRPSPAYIRQGTLGQRI